MHHSNFHHTIYLLLLAETLGAKAADSPIPVDLPTERYSAMSTNCPFAIATPTAPAPVPQASFAATWFVSGIARVGDEDFVTIKARDLSAQFSLFGKEPNATNGVTLASVNWSDTLGKSTVVLRMGNETAQLQFNEAEIHATPAPAPRAKTSPQTAQSGAPPPNSNASQFPVSTSGGPRPNPNPAAFSNTTIPPVAASAGIRRRSVPIPIPNQPRPN